MLKFTHFPKYLSSFCALFLSLLLTLSFNQNVFADQTTPPASTLLFYDVTGIKYYNGTGSFTNCITAAGGVSVSGGTVGEKIWNALINAGFTPEQTAGIMGNMTHESNNFNPVQHEGSFQGSGINILNDAGPSYGIGLIQWSFSRRTGLLSFIQSQDPNLIQYFLNYTTYSPGFSVNGDGFLALAGESVTDRLISLEIQYLRDEIQSNSSYNGILQTTTVEEATQFFLEHVEIPANPYLSAHPERLTSAQAFYDQYSANTTNSSNSSSSSSSISSILNGSDVTIIGDSITVGAIGTIQNKLPGARISASVGRHFSEGISIARSDNLSSTVIFALGTNDSNLTSDQVDEAIATIGVDKTIYFVTNYGLHTNYDSNNNLFAAAASSHSNVHVINWASSASSDPKQYITDADGLGVHLTAAGNQLFADMLSNAISGAVASSGVCLTGVSTGAAGSVASNTAGGNNFQSKVLSYAWPQFNVGITPTNAYTQAVAAHQAASKYVGANGIDCGGFVTILMQDSGFDPDYGGGGNTIVQENYVRAHGWTELTTLANFDISQLQPGDVAFEGAYGSAYHTYVYVGDVPGFPSRIASASQDQRAPCAGNESLTGVRWYRKGST